MSWIRLLIGAASLAAAGAAAARKIARRAVDERKHELLRWAESEARKRIRAEGEAFQARVVQRFIVSTLVKSAMLSALFALLFLSAISPAQFAWGAAALVAAFLVRDVVVTGPELKVAATHLNQNGWSLRRTLGEATAAKALADALQRAEQTEFGWREKVALAVAGTDRDALSREIAESVAHIAGAMAWPELKPYARSTGLKLLGGSLLYTLFAAAIFAAARQAG